MSLERWPNWLRWILFIPAAVVAMVVAHLAVSIAFSGNENEASVFGIGVEGSGAQWINAIKFNLVARFFEPWAFVAVGGIVAPSFPVPAIVLAVLMVLLHLAAPTLYLVGGNTTSTTGVAFLRTAMGIVGAIAGIVAAWRYHSKD